jgi:aspartyl/asparaginyl beta-hydroxylase (cupin superfamily)
MQIGDQDAKRLLGDAFRALQQGRASEARGHLEAAIEGGRPSVQTWFLLSVACRALNDDAAEERAVDQWLEIEPQALHGLIRKGDCRVKAGDDQAATDLYKNALRVAAEKPEGLLQADLAELRRVESAVRELDASIAADLESKLTALGLSPDHRTPRFQHSLDIMAGRKQIYFQSPRGYYFPELPQAQFYDPALFDWAPAVEAATDIIREELQSVLAEGLEGFLPYIRTQPHQPRDHPLLDKLDWSTLFFCENGKLFEDTIARCPRTWEAMQAAPLPWVERSLPTVMFSLLRPGAWIPAHHGVHNTRLICHLPLIVPLGCPFRVGNEERQWEEGKLLIFDDSMEHEAWNESAEDRVVLIFDIWRPELSEQEQREIAALFALAIP